MAEVFLQHLEKSTIKHLMDARILSFYTRYMDDIFLVYDSTCISPDNILQYIDTIHSSIRLNPTLESDNNVNFLDLSITRKPTSLRISIFCKSTTTDTIINLLSNHLLEHKMAAYQFLIRRMISLPLDREQQYKEWQHILHIACSNDIPLALPSSSSSALQLCVSFGLLNYSSPWFPFLCLLFPIIYSHLPQIVSHVIIPS